MSNAAFAFLYLQLFAGSAANTAINGTAAIINSATGATTARSKEAGTNMAEELKDFYDTELGRMVRFAVHLERMISPEGTFPPVGRSLTYKFGAFQNLSLISLLEQLPRYIEPAQVRCALTAVMKNQLRPGTYDENGWLTIGFCGHQPLLVDGYSSTGSVYLCSIVFLPLGLPADNEFWTAPAAQWTSQRAWSGLPIRRDHSIK